MQAQPINSSQGKMKEEDSFMGKNGGAPATSKMDKDGSTDKSRLSEEASGVISNLKHGASQVASRAEEIASDVFDKSKEYGEKLVSDTGSAITRYPAQSLLIAGAVGTLVGYLIARR